MLDLPWISLDPLLFWIPSFTTNPCPSPQEPLQLSEKLGQGLFGVVHLAHSCPDARSKLRPSCLCHVAWMHGERSQDLGNLSLSSCHAAEGQWTPAPFWPRSSTEPALFVPWPPRRGLSYSALGFWLCSPQISQIRSARPLVHYPGHPNLVRPLERVGSASVWQLAIGAPWHAAVPGLAADGRSQARHLARTLPHALPRHHACVPARVPVQVQVKSQTCNRNQHRCGLDGHCKKEFQSSN